MTVKRLLCIAICFSLFAIAGQAMAADKTITWKMATVWPKGTIFQKEGPEHFAALVDKMSNGRLHIKVHAAGHLVGALEVLDATKMGTIACYHGGSVYWMGKMAAAPLFCTYPFTMEPIPYLSWMYHGGGLELYQKLYKGYNIGIALPCGILPIENLAWANKPIKSMEDFKGLKFRTSGWWGEILSKAGASVVMLPGGEVYEALQRKVIDAGEFSIPSMDKDLAFYEIAKYVLGPGVHQITTMLEIVINEKYWKNLPPDLQEIVKVASKATTLNMLTKLISSDMAAVEFLKGKGVKFFHLDPAVQKELKKQAFALIDQKAEKDAFTKEVWTSQKAFMEAYNSYEKFTAVQTD